jgi:Trk K+ transport system NAD-binding subunit
LILSVRRGDETLFATPEMRVRRDDELVVVTRPEHMDALVGLLGARLEPAAGTGAALL